MRSTLYSVMEKRSAMEEKKRKQWIGKGIYQSRDVPIKFLDMFIFGIFAVIIILVIVFAVNGGYNVDFDTNGGSEILTQRLRYGNLIEEPEEPQKAGYVFEGWVTAEDPSLGEKWDFMQGKVEGDMTLYAIWKPAQITVKFDLDGGRVAGSEVIDDLLVTFGEPYGKKLPVPSREGYSFDGWIYSGNVINSDTFVTTSGEHVLTSRWVQE